jgi:hypothetical protein
MPFEKISITTAVYQTLLTTKCKNISNALAAFLSALIGLCID